MLYNFFDAKQSILKEDKVILFEGFMDVISAYNANGDLQFMKEMNT